MSVTEAPGGYSFAGRTFTVPSLFTAVDAEGARLALGVMSLGAVQFGAHTVENAADAVLDLGLVRTGRVPLLAEHTRALDALLGRVVAVEAEGGLLKAVVEFGPTPDADRLWALLSAGFPLSLSLCGQIIAADIAEERDDGSCTIRVTRWRLVEISVVVVGKDPTAVLRRFSAMDEDAAGVIRKMNAVPEPKRRAAAKALHLDQWKEWATATGVAMAEDLGLDRDRVCDALDRHFAEHCEILVRDLAA